MFRNALKTMGLILAICLLTGTARADEVLDAINEAMEAYNDKAYTEAVESLDYAKQLIRQMTSEGMMKFLPEPMEGWQGMEAKSQNLGMMGGSTGVEKEYIKPGSGSEGQKRVILTIMGDSPIVQGMMAMFNPAIAGADGGKLQKIERNKAIVNYKAENRSGEIMIDVDKKYIVTLKGDNVDKEDLMHYAEAIDYMGLKAF